MKNTNPIVEAQRLKEDNEHIRKKYSEIKQENRDLRKEISELKKNLTSF